MSFRRLSLVISAFLTLTTSGPVASAVTSKRHVEDPVVIAVIESGGLNVFHSDFRASPGNALKLPSGMPKAEVITLPGSGAFSERVTEASSGPLGNLKAGRLYRIAGTRIIGVYVGSSLSAPVNLLEDRGHPTGTTSSAVGKVHGTYPGALLVFVPDASLESWQWLADQRWIDIVSVSYFNLIGVSGSEEGNELCGARNAIRDIVQSGRLVFAASGNAESVGTAMQPSGVPEAYQVGGVDDEGRSYRPDLEAASITPTRPYETGDRFDFPAADPDALSGSKTFGGTSGAAPSTAGRAADLIAFSRDLLGGGAGNGALAIAAPGARIPKRGPLSDGRLEAAELTGLLHHLAVPYEPPSPIRYLIEGYGGLSDETVGLGKRVLAGEVPEPRREQEDAVHAVVEQARSAWFSDARCG